LPLGISSRAARASSVFPRFASRYTVAAVEVDVEEDEEEDEEAEAAPPAGSSTP
jgi:hypothetical protein